MDSMIIAFISWIAARSNLVAADPPRIFFAPQQRIGEIYYRTSEPGNALQPRAVYDFRTATVFLHNRWRSSELYDQSVLLHELVHHLQARNKIKVPCQVAFERQAYELQVSWLREQGVKSPYAFMGTNELTIYVASECHDNWGELFKQ